jgi:predicted DCC family thiol-disulfide oxidoreductase YuxK
MNTLYVLYDDSCPHSLRQREWLAQQEPIVPLRLLPHRAGEVSCRFPGIEAYLTPRELTVVCDAGQLWTGPAAAVMCLFVLERHRELAERLTRPMLLPYARTALELLSRDGNVLTMTCLMRNSPDTELANILRMNNDMMAQPRRLPPGPHAPPAYRP